MKEQYTYKLMFGIVIFIGCVMTYGLILRFWPYKTLEIKSVEVLTPEIEVGGKLEYKVSSGRHTDAPSSVYRTIQSVTDPTERFPLPVTDSISVEGCHEIKRSMIIDETVPPGEYFVRVVSVYEINEYQKPKVEFKIGNFTIK